MNLKLRIGIKKSLYRTCPESTVLDVKEIVEDYLEIKKISLVEKKNSYLKVYLIEGSFKGDLKKLTEDLEEKLSKEFGSVNVEVLEIEQTLSDINPSKRGKK